MITLKMPGAVYYECFDPAATEYPREVGLPKPAVIRYGRGRQYVYRVPKELALDMITHAEDFGEAISHGVDDPTAGRTVLRWVEQAREGLR